MRKTEQSSSTILRARSIGSDATGTHPGDQKGVAGPGAFNFGSLDAVNIFNGNLALKIPIGLTFPVGGSFSWGLNLHYNSKVWDYEPGKRGHVDVHFNAGLGWWLSFGFLHQPGEKGGHPSYWVYISSDGSSHQFNESLRHGMPVPAGDQGKVFYTRDGSYLRLTLLNNNTRTIEFPDGRIQSFDQQGRPTELRDRHGNFVRVQYPGENWRIIDRHGRVVNVLFDTSITDPNNQSEAKPQVSEVNYQGFGGQAVRYQFRYRETPQYRKNIPVEIYRKAQINASVRTPLLDQLILPDGSFFNFDYFLKNVEKNDPEGSGVTLFEVPGRIQSLTLPAGGRYEWEYASYYYIEYSGPGQPDPGGNGGRPPYRSPSGDDGIFYKKMYRSDGQQEARWRYRPISNKTTRPGTPENTQTRVEVTDPAGNRTMHYFYREGTDWKTGLPFSLVESHEVDGLKCFLSKEIFDKNNRLLRKEYVRYTADPVAFLRAANPRMTAQRTVFWDDGQRYIERSFSDFDGLGNFRRVKTKGNLHGVRAAVDYTNWNPFSRHFDYDRMDNQYEKNDFEMPLSSDPWVLKIVVAKIRQEQGRQSKTKYFVQRKTGFVLGKRVQLGNQPHPDDLLELHQPDGFGNVLRTAYYGGDGGGLPASNDYGVLANNLPTPDYEIVNTYQFGVRKTSKYTGPGTESLYLLNRQIDKPSGLASKEWDTSMMATTFEYDEMGRLRKVKPVHGKGASTIHEYTVRPGGSKINTVSKDEFAPGQPELARSRTHFDDFGRVVKEENAYSLDPLQWAEQRTVYNENGQKAKVTEWAFGHTGKATEYRQYDPFGRVGKIITADGQETTFQYKGQREVRRTAQVRTTTQGAQPVLRPATTIEYYDHLGRLFRVEEPSGPNGGMNRIDYSYDIGNRLETAVQYGSGVSQARRFTYDNRGLLKQEQHPEKGVNGNGVVKYSNYDARGHARNVEDGRSVLTYVYDKAERLASVWEGGKLWKSFEYATSNGGGGNWRLGKVEKAMRKNYVTIPGQNNELTVTVTETYTYQGRLGKPSRRHTNIYLGANDGHTFEQSFEYDALGNITRLHYPVKTPDNPWNNLPRSIKNEYTAGRLTSVQGLRANGALQENYAPQISYHANGIPHEVRHGNGVRYIWDQHPHQMARPWIIRVQFPNGGAFLRGPHHFDGAGNIMRIEGANQAFEDYEYDHVSRLTRCRNGGGGWQQYSFDPFGNLHQINNNGQFRDLAVNTRTNRFKAIGYDAAGNQLHSHDMPSNGIAKAHYKYDSLNMIWGIDCGDLFFFNIYTADDERAWHLRYRKSSKTFEQGVFSIRDLGHRLLRQFKSEGAQFTIDRDYVYRGKTLLATNSMTEGVRHAHPDHLGSPMGYTDAQGNVKSTHFYFGFGEEYTNSNADAIPLKFTGHERDAMEPGKGLDYMHARFYSPLFGRFLSVDPAKSWKPKNPQSWNRYAYALGNPVKYLDPDGRVFKEAKEWGKAVIDVIDEKTLGKLSSSMRYNNLTIRGQLGLTRSLTKNSGFFQVAYKSGQRQLFIKGMSAVGGAISGAFMAGWEVGRFFDKKYNLGSRFYDLMLDPTTIKDKTEADAHNIVAKAEETLNQKRAQAKEDEEFQDAIDQVIPPIPDEGK